MSELEIARVVEVFEKNHAGWALVGAHAVALLTEPRATADFDFIVESSKLEPICRDLTEVFGDLGENDIGAAIQLKAIDVEPPCVISLAKREEEIYVPGEPEPRKLSRHSYALRLLQYVRDEAHRFAQQYHHLLRRKSTLEE